MEAIGLNVNKVHSSVKKNKLTRLRVAHTHRNLFGKIDYWSSFEIRS